MPCQVGRVSSGRARSFSGQYRAPMDLTQTDTNITSVCGVAKVIGVFGVVIPFPPGLLPTWASATAWAIFVGEGAGRGGMLALVTVIAILGIVVQDRKST